MTNGAKQRSRFYNYEPSGMGDTLPGMGLPGRHHPSVGDLMVASGRIAADRTRIIWRTRTRRPRRTSGRTIRMGQVGSEAGDGRKRRRVIKIKSYRNQDEIEVPTRAKEGT